MANSPHLAFVDFKTYEMGFDARLRGASQAMMLLSLNWVLPSWRAGWNDAGQEVHLHPELKRQAARRSRTKKKST